MSTKSNNKEFIEKAREIHGDKYDYSKVKYTGALNKVTIICPIHGEFEQKANNHLIRDGRKIGCPNCGKLSGANLRTLSTEEFLKKSIKVHGNKYDYSKTYYDGNKNKIIIICPIHGEFTQTSNSHLDGHGCPKCAGNFLDKDYFIKKAREKHGNKYNYSLVNFKSSHVKCIIICPIHGEFLQSPSSHMIYGCQKCAGNFPNKDYFIEKSKKIHGNKYDYSKVIYKNNKKHIIIICPIHGEFLQKPNNHLSGNGCPVCKESQGEKLISNILKNHNVNYTRQKTFKDLKNQSLLRFDFYIPELNTCIEYDGKQHFYPIMYWGGEETLNYIKHVDKLKTEYCEKNNIPLLRLTYKDNSNDIEIKLLEFLSIKNEHLTILFEEFAFKNQHINPNRDFFLWISPDNKIHNVYEFGHIPFMRKIYPNENPNKLYKIAYDNGWTRVQYYKSPITKLNGDLSITAIDLKKIKYILKKFFKNFLSEGSKDIVINWGYNDKIENGEWKVLTNDINKIRPESAWQQEVEHVWDYVRRS